MTDHKDAPFGEEALQQDEQQPASNGHAPELQPQQQLGDGDPEVILR
jgi:hypothetical protein